MLRQSLWQPYMLTCYSSVKMYCMFTTQAPEFNLPDARQFAFFVVESCENVDDTLVISAKAVMCNMALVLVSGLSEHDTQTIL